MRRMERVLMAHLPVELIVGCPDCGAREYRPCAALFMGRAVDSPIHPARTTAYENHRIATIRDIGGRNMPNEPTEKDG